MTNTDVILRCSECLAPATYTRLVHEGYVDGGAQHECEQCARQNHLRDCVEVSVLTPAFVHAVDAMLFTALTREQITAVFERILDGDRDVADRRAAPWERGFDYDDRYVRIEGT